MNLRWQPISIAWAMTLALLAGGCTLPTRSADPTPELPTAAGWSGDGTSASIDARATLRSGPDRTPTGAWWLEFSDAPLNALVDEVVSVNADLAAAGLRLRQARLSYELAASQLLPTLSLSASSADSRGLGASNNTVVRSSSASLSATWQVDLFGQLAWQRDAARWEAVATERDLDSTRLSLIGTTIQAWYQLAYVNERLATGAESLAYARRAQQLVQLQYAAGAVSRLELRDAEQTVASQEALQEVLIQSRTQARNALAALLNRQVYDGPELGALPSAALPEVDAGVPSELLGRRPDLAAAELRLRKTLATAEATRASYYPGLALTGALGTSSASLLRFLSNPVASLGVGLTQSVLNPDRLRAASGVAQADVAIAAASFRQTFYDALRDTDNALTARTQYLRQGEALQRSFDAAVDAEQLYERQYRAGAITLRLWLDAQERRRTAQSNLSENRLNRLNAQVALYQALGGDFAAMGR